MVGIAERRCTGRGRAAEWKAVSARRPVALLVSIVALAVAVVACSSPSSAPTGGTSPTLGGLATIGPGATGTRNPATAAASRPAASGGSHKPYPTKNPAATPRPVVAFHSVGDLEARLPTQVAGATLVTESVEGAGFRDAHPHKAGLRCHWYEGRGLRCRDQKQLDAVLAALGHPRDDVSIGVSYTVERGGAEIQVMRVEGVSGSALRDAVIAAMSADATKRKRQLDVQTTNLGGRDVRILNSPRAYPLGKRFLYAASDALYEVRMVADNVAAQVIAGLT